MNKRFKLPRMTDWLLVSLFLLYVIHDLAPQQLPVSLYKLSLITMAAVVGYWIDRSVFPYARPDAFMQRPFTPGSPYVPEQQIVFAVAMLRRAIIIGCAMLAVSLGV